VTETKSPHATLMQLRGLAKAFPNGTVALHDVSLDIEQGQVHGLLGANGAGKSTLIRILSGDMRASGGEIIWRGQSVSWNSPKAANNVGVATVYQHIPLVSSLSVLENIFLGHQGHWRRSFHIEQRFSELCESVGYWLDPQESVGNLSIGARQMVAIFKALSTGADLLVLDEPTASLAREERARVYETVQRLSKIENKAILFVSHFLDEIMALTDCVTVLRDGRVAIYAQTRDIDEEQIAEAILGKRIVSLEQTQRRSPSVTQTKHAMLEIKKLASPGKLEPISFDVAAGEVVGVAGLLGSGRSELLHAIFGADPQATGEVICKGKILPRGVPHAVRAGIGLVPEDRMVQGLVPDFEIWRNTTLPALHTVSRFHALPIATREQKRGWQAIEKLAIKAHSPDILVSELSGGNAQKVTIAKWLFSDIDLFLLDEPTAGIDIGAKTDILFLVRELVAQGKAVIVVSSEFEELLAVCDRILVMRDRRCIAERRVSETSQQQLLLLAGSQKDEETAPPFSSAFLSTQPA